MSKNIEEIVESVLPYDYKYTSDYLHSRDLLKQALTEGKLVAVEDCPYCPNQGWYCDGPTDEPEQVQCQFCYTNPRSRFNLFPPTQEPITSIENDDDLPF